MEKIIDITEDQLNQEIVTSDSRPVVSIVLPAYNEEEAVTPTLEELRKVLEATGKSWEILVVDDCSGDKTAELAEAAGARVIRRMRNGGAGASRRTGIMAARGEIVVMM